MRSQLSSNDWIDSTFVTPPVNITQPACLLFHFNWALHQETSEATSYVHLVISQHLSETDVAKWRALSPELNQHVYSMVALPLGIYRVGFEARGSNANLDVSSVRLTMGSCVNAQGKLLHTGRTLSNRVLC